MANPLLGMAGKRAVEWYPKSSGSLSLGLRGLCFLLLWAFSPLCHGHGEDAGLVAEITQKLEKTPDDAALRFQLAGLHAKHGWWPEALEEVERIEKLAPGKYVTGLIKGTSLAAVGRVAEAKSALDEFLKGNPNHVEAIAQRARVLLLLENHEAALVDYRLALEKTVPPSAGLYVEVAKVCREYDRLDEAVGLLRRGLDLLGDDPALLIHAVDVETEAGNFDAALTRLGKLQELWPRPEPMMARRAELLAKAGRPDEAQAAWRKLHAHLQELPDPLRGSPFMRRMLSEAERALGIHKPTLDGSSRREPPPPSPGSAAPED